MTKKELTRDVAKRAGIPYVTAGKAVDAVFNSIQGSLARNETVAIQDFGSFSVKQRAARKGTNPATKALIDIPARAVPTFRAGKGLKTAVKG